MSVVASAALLSTLVFARAQEPVRNQPGAQEAQPAPLPPAPDPKAQAPQEPTFDELVRDASASYRPLVISELRFIRRACGVSDSELKPIVREASRLLKETAAKAAKAEQKKLRNLGKVLPAGDESKPEPTLDTTKLIVRPLAQAAQACLTTSQWSRYLDEVAKRRAHRKRVAIANLVAKLDFHLVLSEQQRRDLSTSLASDWNESWGLFVVVTADNDIQQFPPIPDAKIAPFLTASQQKLWKLFPKQDPDESAGLAGLAVELSGEAESEFDGELGKPQIEARLGRLGAALGE
jgi:hypothetical protein